MTQSVPFGKPDQDISAFRNILSPARPAAPDYADLERRVGDLEDRARKQDAAERSKDRLREMGFVFQGDKP